MARSRDWVTEPDADRGDVENALVNALALVEAGGHGATLAEIVDAALDGVALLVAVSVEGWWPSALEPSLARLACWSLLIGITGLVPRWRR
ncbi:hypothetical protein GCM10020216_106500 [Nonomuraea helvata]